MKCQLYKKKEIWPKLDSELLNPIYGNYPNQRISIKAITVNEMYAME